MATRLAIMTELDKRGSLPEDKRSIFEEIKRRGLTGPSREQLRETTPFEIETAQFGGEVTPAVARTPEEQLQLKQNVAGVARTGLEFGLGTAGFELGLPFGPAGAVGLGGFGFAAGDFIADRFEEFLGVKPPQSLRTTILDEVSNVGLGGIYETLGLGIPSLVVRAVSPVKTKVIKWVGKLFPSWSKASIRDKATKILESLIRTPENTARQSAKIAEARELEKVFPGLKFKTGQLLDDRNVIRLEKELTRTGTGVGELRAAQQVEAAQTAIQSKVRNVFPSQQGLDDILLEVQKQSDELTDALIGTTTGRDRLVERLTPLKDIQAGGRTVSGTLGTEQKIMRAKGGSLFDAVGNPDVPGDELLSSLRKVKAEFFEFGGKTSDFPGEIDALIDKLIQRPAVDAFLMPLPKAKNISYQKLRGFQSRIGASSSKIKGSPTGGDATSNALDRAFATIEDSGFSFLTGNKLEEHQIARNFWANNVGKKFGSGTTRKVLRPGVTSASTKVGPASTAGEFFGKTSKDLDAADDLIRAIGPERAREVMRDFTAMELMETKSVIDRVTGDINSGGLANWVTDHAAILKKYGLFDEYSSILTAQQAVDAASDSLNLFNKTAASKMLNGDVNLAMTRAFEGQKDILGTMKDLIRGMRGNKSAVRGLESSFADFIERQILDQTDDLITNPVRASKVITKMIDKYGKAMELLYRRQPKKLGLLRDIKKAFGIMAREGELTGRALDDPNALVDKLIRTAGAFATDNYAQRQGILRIIDYMENLSQKQINSILLKAAFDPDYAELLLLPKLVPVDKFEPALANLISRLGLVGGKAAKEALVGKFGREQPQPSLPRITR